MKKELKIGIFAVSVIIVAFFVLNYLRGEDIFDREIDVVAYCDDVNGLVASAPVYVKGYKAGQVSSVEYDGDNACFEIVCSVMKEFNLSSDSRMVIYSADIMGAKAVRIDGGTSELPLNDGDTLQLVIEPGLTDNLSQAILPLISTASKTLDSLNVTITGINSLLTESNTASISATIANLERTMVNVRKISASVNGKSEEICSLITNLSSFSADLKGMAEKLDTAVTGVNGIVSDLDKADLEGTVSSFKNLLDKVQDPEGSLGKLINSDSVYNSVDSLLTDINFFVDKIKENPRKYLKISVF